MEQGGDNPASKVNMKYSEVYRSLGHLHEKQPTHLVTRRMDELVELKLAYYIPKEEHRTNLVLAEEYGNLREEERRFVGRSGSVDFERYKIKQSSTLWHWLWTKRETLKGEQEKLKKLSEEEKILSGNIRDVRKKIIEVVKIFDKYDPWRQPYVSGSGVVFHSDGIYSCFDADPETKRWTGDIPSLYEPIRHFDPRKFIARFFKMGKKKDYVAPSGLGTCLLLEAKGKKKPSIYSDPTIRRHIQKAIKDDPEFSWEHFYQPEIRLRYGEERFRERCLSVELDWIWSNAPWGLEDNYTIDTQLKNLQ